jgi:hypothetical protein
VRRHPQATRAGLDAGRQGPEPLDEVPRTEHQDEKLQGKERRYSDAAAESGQAVGEARPAVSASSLANRLDATPRPTRRSASFIGLAAQPCLEPTAA